MTIDATQDLSLLSDGGNDPCRLFGSRLLIKGRLTPTRLYGDRIELQLRFNDGYLVITEYDYFDSSNWWINLLTKDGRVLDVVAPPDSFGYVKDVQINGSTQLRVVMYTSADSEDWWDITVDPTGFPSFALRHLRMRLNRFLLRRRHLSLQCRRMEARSAPPESAAVLDAANR